MQNQSPVLYLSRQGSFKILLTVWPHVVWCAHERNAPTSKEKGVVAVVIAILAMPCWAPGIFHGTQKGFGEIIGAVPSIDETLSRTESKK